MRVLIHPGFGGFGITDAAVKRMRELGSEWAKRQTCKGERYPESDQINDWCENHLWPDQEELPRNDPILLRVYDEMGDQAGRELMVVKIPDDVEFVVEEYDGAETVEEAHRTFY
jgi:hypothetical protein